MFSVAGGGGPETPEIPNSTSAATRTDPAKALSEVKPWRVVTHTHMRGSKKIHWIHVMSFCVLFTILITMPIMSLRTILTPRTVEIKSISPTLGASPVCAMSVYGNLKDFDESRRILTLSLTNFRGWVIWKLFLCTGIKKKSHEFTFSQIQDGRFLFKKTKHTETFMDSKTVMSQNLLKSHNNTTTKNRSSLCW